jgi:hypothetical protein
MQTSTTSSASKIVLGLLFGGSIVMAFSSTACSVTVTADCVDGFTACGDICADTADDPDNCGGCGISCGGDECIAGECATVACVDDDGACTADGDCCSLFCASDGACGCIESGDDSTFCSDDSDCCSGDCDLQSGICN